FRNAQGVIYKGGWNKTIGVGGNFRYSPNNNLSITYYTHLNRGKVRWVPEGSNADGFILNATRGPGADVSGSTGCADKSLPCSGIIQILTKINSTTLRYHYINSLSINLRSGKRLQNSLTIGDEYIHHKGQD